MIRSIYSNDLPILKGHLHDYYHEKNLQRLGVSLDVDQWALSLRGVVGTPGFIGRIMLSDRSVMGSAAVVIREGFFDPKQLVGTTLWWHVVPEYRRRGYGKLLLEDIEQEVSQIAHVLLFTVIDNEKIDEYLRSRQYIRQEINYAKSFING